MQNQPDSNEFDEMVTGDGQIRPHWRGFLSGLSGLPEGGLAERSERARLLLQDDGVSFADVQATPASAAWPFDAVPLILPADDWNTLEAGITQRMRLLEALLVDVYGPQNTLKSGLFPPELLFANPGFLRAARRDELSPPAPQLFHYAVDLVRCPDGRFRVLADRCQTPVGAGYALENRRVMARTLPELFAACPVRPLTGWFEEWEAGLKALAPRGAHNPRLALLSPGPSADTYFEHVYLARELGLTLVEGGDLTCRGGRVYLKALGGLQPVDVVLRRIDGDYLDPLVAREDSLLGVAGLLPAALDGTVALANSAGSGILDDRRFHSYLPELCRHLLGEDLQLSSLPEDWDGKLGITPHLRDGQLQPAETVIRCFAIQAPAGIVVMPGGLARLPGSADPARLRLPGGAITKDVWVLAGDVDERLSTPAANLPPVTITRTRGELSSRMAENLFWLGRYIERLDNGCRLLRSAHMRLGQGSIGARAVSDLAILSGILSNAGFLPPSAAGLSPDSRAFAHAVMQAGGSDQPLAGIFRMIGRAALSLRERIAADLWQTLSLLLVEGQRAVADATGSIDGSLAALDRVIRITAAVAGMASEGMTRGTGWRFLDLGRRIERGLYTAGSARVALAVPGPALDGALRLALELCDSAITYRYRYLSALQAAPVLDLIIADETNPRALAYQLDTAAMHLSSLPGEDALPLLPQVELMARALRLAVQQPEPLAPSRHAIDRTTAGLADLSNALSRAYFSHLQTTHTLHADWSMGL